MLCRLVDTCAGLRTLRSSRHAVVMLRRSVRACVRHATPAKLYFLMAAAATATAGTKGVVRQVIGPVLDVEFPAGKLP
ncbi:MAG TPA: F0F1 ATP synthase subunit beta, partial [Prochlorococcus sp.]|nr:F0F1 ATP synthase subunit beta [Prochlorococcus sp.]